MNSYYGGYRTRTFANIFPSFEEFKSSYEATSLVVPFTPDYNPTDPEAKQGLTLKQLYYMLYAHYGNSHIAYSDENQFKYYMYSIIYQYAPTVIRKREIRCSLLKLSDAQLIEGGKAIYNSALNPGTEPSVASLEELLYINSQNTTNYKKSMVEGLTGFLAVLDDDPIDSFIHKFKQLFIQVLSPDYPLLYETTTEGV